MLKNKTFLFFSFLLLPVAVFAQVHPVWLEANIRTAQYPASVYLTGFASGNESLEKIKTAAQTSLIENLRVVVTNTATATTQMISDNNRYDEQNVFNNLSEKVSDAEIAGMKVECYTEPKTKTNFAFAYVNKYELIGYYKSNLSVNLRQIESFVKTAQDLEENTEKAKARQQLEQAKPIFAKVRYAQDLLTAIDPNISVEDLQQAKTESMYNTFTQMQARLAQGVFVYIESKEDLFGTKVDIVANQLKAELAKNGCSFTEDAEKADFWIRINISTRVSSSQNNIVFCYADTSVELYDNYKQKIVYGDEIAQKGGSNSQEKAGRQAMSDVTEKIVEKLKPWIQ